MSEKMRNKHDSTTPYRKIKGGSSVISSRWREALDQNWMYYYGWSATPLSPEMWRQEKLLCSINEKFKFAHVALLRAAPYSNYNWHVDTNRGCSINMLLSEGKSNTFFASPSPEDYHITEGVHNSCFTELKYDINEFYAFNPQRPHCVFNFEEIRYLFSCEFSETKDLLSYERVCRWLDEAEL
jgi:hypothetical protein